MPKNPEQLANTTRAPTHTPGDHDAELAFARDVLRAEAEAIESLAGTLGREFHDAVDRICQCVEQGGTVLVTGLGKSGLIGAKISATLASLGIPSHSVHPSEAAHGDLGRFRASDVALCLSFSGETEEVVNLAAILKQDKLPIISITRRSTHGSAHPSTLERLASVALTLPFEDEAAAGFAAPTSSTTATLALGDALALAAARRRHFSTSDFHKRHPGGSLGGQLRPVTDVLRFRAGENLPLAIETATVREALTHADGTPRRPGALLIVNPATGVLTGIFTDSDLRRLMLRDTGALDQPLANVMTRGPRTIPADALVRDALLMIREHRQDEVPVIDRDGKPVGLLDVQDLIALRLIRRED